MQNILRVNPKLQAVVDSVSSQYYLPTDEKFILIQVSEQRLYLIENKTVYLQYGISTSRYGTGNKENSYKTPTGMHRIAEKIGDRCKFGEIFCARVATGEVADILNDMCAPQKDVITTRILWLKGEELYINRGKGVDSYSRYIYIHGTNEEGLIGTPASIGCIRMRNLDVMELFDFVHEGMFVYIRN